MIFVFLLIVAIVILNIIFKGTFVPGLILCMKDKVQALFHRKEPKPFDLYGVYLYCGRVGCGKTISMVARATQVKHLYPNVKIYSNFECDISDGVITSWEQLEDLHNFDKNGNEQGILFLFDEIHLTFSSQAWQTAPDNLLSYISLQRKNKKCIFCSSQVWTRVNKVIREQADYIIECKPFLGRRVIRNKYYLQEDYLVNGDQKSSGMRKRFVSKKAFVLCSDKLRSLYNTDEIIKGLDSAKRA